jgi:hypothetical protein
MFPPLWGWFVCCAAVVHVRKSPMDWLAILRELLPVHSVAALVSRIVKRSNETWHDTLSRLAVQDRREPDGLCTGCLRVNSTPQTTEFLKNGSGFHRWVRCDVKRSGLSRADSSIDDLVVAQWVTVNTWERTRCPRRNANTSGRMCERL